MNEKLKIQVYRSNRQIAIQIIEDETGKVVVSGTTMSIDKTKKNSDIAIKLADQVSKKIKEKKLTKLTFNRGKYRYTGKIKVIADQMRKNGVKI
ncbi:hypothetical protein DID75_05685 [Candidatus Marinamargulisbacteria bacterium SCGC AG-410-N11]|nr:hypothetical protein DID75_05685 [Candidatus Marinamargulisbacteria bacterium SCGC AG-410-N11]